MTVTNSTLPYDKTSATSIFEYSKGLLGNIWNSNKYTSNDVFKFPSSTIRQHEFLKTRILNTMYSHTNSWNHLFSSSLTNTRANAWNARCHQGNGNIVVQRLVHLSKLRASAPS